MTKIALCLIRPNSVYRHDAFIAGMQKLGFQTETQPFRKERRPTPDDVVLIWNRYGTGDRQAALFEQNGAAVIVVENSYVNIRGSRKSFAMALNRHNGAGHWPAPEYSRFETLDIEVKPWKESGTHILVLPQRGIGLPGVAMPKDWPGSVVPRIKRISKSTLVHLRPHPGTTREARPLSEDFEPSWCAVTWGSSAATKALIEGVPVFYEFPQWIAGSGACFGVNNISLENTAHTLMGDRIEMLENLSWAQWSIDEVMTGEPMRRLLELHKRRMDGRAS